MPQVYSKRNGKKYPDGAALVDRTTPFGNPFHQGTDGDRLEVIRKYNVWIHRPEQGKLRGLIRQTLEGRDLVCWCSPLPCHADIILRIANEEIE